MRVHMAVRTYGCTHAISSRACTYGFTYEYACTYGYTYESACTYGCTYEYAGTYHTAQFASHVFI